MVSTPQSTPSRQLVTHSSRRHARQLALQILFQYEFHKNLEQWVEEFWAKQTVTPEVRSFSDDLVQGVITNQVEVDLLINRFAVEWRVERMPVVDRNILRLAIFELIWMPDVPAKVTVNEAIELAKRFADDETKGFINGILDHILQDEPRLQEKRAEVSKKTVKTSTSSALPTPRKNKSPSHSHD